MNAMPTYQTPDPIDVVVDVVGDVRLSASDRTDTVVTVLPRNPANHADVTIAEQTTIELTAGTLRVRTPKRWTRYTPFGPGSEAVEVTIELPTGSRVEATSGIGDFRADGELGACNLKTAMGSIRLDHTATLRAVTSFGAVTVDHVAGDAEVSTGSGEVRLGDVEGALVIKNSNGDSEVGEATGDVRVKAANGDITIARALDSVTARTANGDVRVRDARHGEVVMETAAGELEVGIPLGTAAYLDLNSRFGAVRNDLDPSDVPAASDRTVRVRARTSYGDILVRRATATNR
jgi:DUF4097 and DUF4098 domain-containing protein YvlB